MAWKCNSCGTENTENSAPCLSCGEVRLADRILLRSKKTGNVITISLSQTIGLPLLKKIDPEDGVFSSTEQFQIEKSQGKGWLITGCRSAKNPVFVNGAEVPAEGNILKTGDIISLKDKALFMDVELAYE